MPFFGVKQMEKPDLIGHSQALMNSAETDIIFSNIGLTQLKIIFKLCTSVMEFSTFGKRNLQKYSLLNV